MQRVRRVAVPVVVVLVLAAAVSLLLSRHLYKEWPWSSYPNPLHWCGRDYTPERVETRAEILRQHSGPFQKAGDLPGWLNRGDVWTIEPGSSCGAAASLGYWVKLSDDRFELMSLEGSP